MRWRTIGTTAPRPHRCLLLLLGCWGWGTATSAATGAACVHGEHVTPLAHNGHGPIGDLLVMEEALRGERGETDGGMRVMAGWVGGHDSHVQPQMLD